MQTTFSYGFFVDTSDATLVMSEISKKLKSIRSQTGLSIVDFSKEIDMPATSYAYYENGYKKSSLPESLIVKLVKSAARLNLDPLEIEGLGPAPITIADDATPSTQFPKADLPILGKVMGGVGVFFDNGASLGETMRPLSLVGVRDAYAAYIDGESMIPRYYPGELAMAHPHKMITRGSFVIVQYDDDNGDRCYTIKQFIKRSGGTLYLEQLNPEAEFNLPLDRVHAIHRVVGAIDT